VRKTWAQPPHTSAYSLSVKAINYYADFDMKIFLSSTEMSKNLKVITLCVCVCVKRVKMFCA